MHISEGVLSAPVIAGGFALTAAGTWYGLRQLDDRQVVTAAALAATFFLGSLVHVPLGPSSVHLLLNGVAGVVLGWAAFPCIFVALLLQAVLFQFGGLTALGVNTLNVALPAVIAHFCVREFIARGGTSMLVGAFMGGGGAVLVTSILTALSLGFSDSGFWTTAQLVVVSHLPVAGIEGVVTAFIVAFVARTRPELLKLSPTVPKGADVGA